MIRVQVADYRSVSPSLDAVREQGVTFPHQMPRLAVIHELLEAPRIGRPGSLQKSGRNVLDLRHPPTPPSTFRALERPYDPVYPSSATKATPLHPDRSCY